MNDFLKIHNNNNRLLKRTLAMLLTLVLIFGLIPLPNIQPAEVMANEGGTPNITVSFAVYDYTAYGNPNASSTGIILNLPQVNVSNNSTALDVIKAGLGSNNINYVITNSQFGDYISSVNGLAEHGCEPESGWMFSVNDNYGSTVASATYLANGDVIKLHYSVKGYGTDVGSYWSGGPTISKLTLGGVDTVISNNTIYSGPADYAGTTSYYLGKYVEGGANIKIIGDGTLAAPYVVPVSLSGATDITNLVAQITSTLHPKYISYGIGQDLTDISKASNYNKDVTFCLQTIGGQFKTYYTIKVTKQPIISDMEFLVTPDDAVLKVYDSTGVENLPIRGTTKYTSLTPSAKYTYNVSKNGFITEHGTFITGESSQKVVTLNSTTLPTIPLPKYTGDWINFRGNDENMGITTAKTPRTAEETRLKWAVKYSSGWGESITPPIILNDCLYIAKGKRIVKINKNSGELIASSADMVSSVGFALNPITYGDGMIFVPIGLGRVQALRADTLESIWVSEQLGGQTLTPLTYKNGYLYTGTWNSEIKDGTYFCIPVTDEDTSRTDETKYCTWKINHKGGFYWAGAYATKDYVIFGGDDGDSGNISKTAVLYSVNPTTGEIIDKVEKVAGDIRSTVSYDSKTDSIYFTTKGGSFYKVKVNTNGTFDDSKTQVFDLGGMSTGTPLVFNGLAYIGASGNSQFSPNGHSYIIMDVTTSPMKRVGTAEIPGYVQTSALLSTAFSTSQNKVYVYATYNCMPGGIYVIEIEKTSEKDADGAAIVKTLGSHLFVPTDDKKQYCICSLVCDRDGTLYYKNDSGYLMAVSNKPLVDKVITDFSIGNNKGIIDQNAKTISVTVAYDANVKELTPTILVSDKATVSPASGITIDFTNHSTYTVTAEDGSKQEYIVTVTKRDNSGGGNKPQDQLSKDKALAKASLVEAFTKCDKSDYTTENWVLVKAAYDQGVTKVENETSYAGVYAALNATLEAIGKVTTNSSGTITVCASMEKFTLGQGYIIEPTLVRVPKYTQASVVITNLLKQKYPSMPQPWRMTGTVKDSFYLSYVHDTDTNVNIPNYILNALGGKLDTRGSNTLLGEFDYSNWSGWMYCINDKFPGVGASSWRLQDRETMRWQFTLYGYGADIDANNVAWGQASLKNLANKDALMWRVAEINGMSNKDAVLTVGNNAEKYNIAMKVLTKIDSTQAEIDNALTALNNLSSNNAGGVIGGIISPTQTEIIKPSTLENNGSATASVTKEEANKAIESAKKNNAVQIIINPEVKDNITSLSVVIPKNVVDSITKDIKVSLLVKTAIGDVNIPHGILTTITNENGLSVDINIKKVSADTLSEKNKTLTGKRPIYNLSIGVDGKKIKDFGSEQITVAIPYTLFDGENEANLIIYYIDDNGIATKVNGAKYDKESRAVVFQTNHFSVFAIGYSENKNGIKFDDVEVTHWATEYIYYLANKGIVNGKSDTIFAPNDNITRAEFVSILARISGDNLTEYEGNLDDVNKSDWFSKSVEWAVKNGITNGVSEKLFASNDNISRQDMAVMIMRFVKYMNIKLQEKSEQVNFKDEDNTSAYANEAIKAMQKAGIISGKDNNMFMPQDNATRAESAKIITIVLKQLK